MSVSVYNSSHRLKIVRADALQAYATVEQSLCVLLSILLRIPIEQAGTIFFRMVNARSRIAVLQDLLKDVHEDKFKPFWTPTSKRLVFLDGERNKIVHWHMGVFYQGTDAVAHLAKPTGWFPTDDDSRMFVEEIETFSLECEFWANALASFGADLRPKPLETDDALPSIFLQPIAYPPPESHPLHQIWLRLTLLPRPYLT